MRRRLDERDEVPQLSVVLPVHNGAKYVESSVRSILDQDFRRFELVIGDDGSTDETPQLLAALASQDGRIRVLRRDRRSGVAESANWVVSQARSDLVAMAHADDLYHRHRLSSQMAEIDAQPDVVLVGTLCNGIGEDGEVARGPSTWRLSPGGAPLAPFPHSSIMFRKLAFEAAGNYRTQAEYWEDHDLYWRIVKQGRIVVIPRELVSHRYSRASSRIREDELRIYEAIDLMYHSMAALRRGEDYDGLLDGRPRAGEALNPLTFVARGNLLLWSNQTPKVLRSLLSSADLGPNLGSLYALLWACWARCSPATLRACERMAIRVANWPATRRYGAAAAVDWRPIPVR